MREKTNIYKELRESTETNNKPALTQGELAAIFSDEGNPLSQSVISKLENQQKEPPSTSPDVIKAYSTHFKVTADYLLGLRNTKIADEDIAMICKTTGLNEEAIKTLKILKKSDCIDILNFIMTDYAIFGAFLSNIKLYFDNTFDTPVHYDDKLQIFVESNDLSDSPIINTNGERYIAIGKKLNYEVANRPAYETIHIPTSILESHAMHHIQSQFDSWKKEYKRKD